MATTLPPVLDRPVRLVKGAVKGPAVGARRPGRAAVLLRPLHRVDLPRRHPLQEGGRAPAGRGDPRHRRAGRRRRHGRRHRLPHLLHRHRGRPAGLRRAQPARRLELHGLPVGLLQHPRDRPARRGAGAVGDGGLRLHGPAGRHAHLRGGRRPRGHGHPVAALPRDHAHDRRASSPSRRSTSSACCRPTSPRAPSRPASTASPPARTTSTSASTCPPRTCSTAS